MRITENSDRQCASPNVLESIRSVSDEILLEIFLAQLRPTGKDPSYKHSGIMILPASHALIGSVCRRWRAVAVSASRLWSSICINIDHPSRFADAQRVFRLFAARSGACSLDIVIYFGQREYRVGFREPYPCPTMT